MTLAGLRFHEATNTPYWKIDKYVRKLLGPNPFRAHDAIGARGADFLTWSCLHHLSETYGPLFTPTDDLVERKETGQEWYPPNHFRPLVDWPMSPEEAEDFEAWILGPLFQMTALMLHENRAHPAHLNAIGELCAQFRKGILAEMRARGETGVAAVVARYQELHPVAAETAWHAEALKELDGPACRQLYVNAEHDGTVGVVTLSRESYNWDVDRELNRALDWLLEEGVRRVIVTSDFHISTQMVGADTGEFFAALEELDAGLAITRGWSATGRRLWADFDVSVAVVPGKRCLGGMLELLMHAHHLVAVEDARLGWPEVTLPVVPGMEACHWPLRRAPAADRPRVLEMLLTGRPVRALEGAGWLVDVAAPLDEALGAAWGLATADDPSAAPRRGLEEAAMVDVLSLTPELPEADGPAMEAGREAIRACIQASCGVPSGEALEVQARRAAEFLAGPVVRKGAVGAEYARATRV